MLACIGEAFEYENEVCGAVVSVRKAFFRIALWTRSSDNQEMATSIGYGWAHGFGNMEIRRCILSLTYFSLFRAFFALAVPSRRPPTSTAPLSSRATTNLPRLPRLGPCKYPPTSPFQRHSSEDLEPGVFLQNIQDAGALVLLFIRHHLQCILVTSHLLFSFFFFLLQFFFCTIPCTLSIPHAQHYHQSISQATDLDSHIQNTYGFANNLQYEKV